MHKAPKILLLIILIIVLTQAASAKIIFDDWVTEATSFNISGEPYIVGYYPQVSKVSIRTPNLTVLVGLGDCEVQEGKKYCFDELDNDTIVEYVSSGAYQEAVERNKIKIIISELAPVIKTTLTLNDTSISPGDEAHVVVELKNIGDKVSGHIEMRVPIPYTVRSKGFYKDRYSNDIFWEGKLLPDEEKNIKFTVVAKELGELNLTAKLKHIPVEGENQTILSNTKTLKIIPPFEFYTELNSDVALSNESIGYTLFIENKHQSEDMTVREIKIKIPEELEFDVPNKLRKKETVINLDDDTLIIHAGETRKFFFNLTTEKVGEYDIEAFGRLSMGNDNEEFTVKDRIAYGNSKVVTKVDISPEIISSFQKIKVNVSVINKDSVARVVDVNIKSNLIGNMLIENVNLTQGQTKLIFEQELTAPSTSNIISRYVKATSKFKDKGTNLEFTRETKVIINPRSKVVAMDTNYKVRGEETDLLVTVKNMQDSPVKNVEVVDTIPDGLFIIAGNRVSKTVDLSPGETRVMLNYTFKTKPEYKSKVVHIPRTLTAESIDGEPFILDESSTIQLATSDNLTDKETNPSVTDEANLTENIISNNNKNNNTNNSEAQVGTLDEVEKVEKDNFFIGIFEGIREFFKSFF